ncbi:dethiobiotin synthetase [Georgfuchsia toluolica]|uniref:ATP-dependent dethiobiotin synthetase BioD n=1 Tax=Georgfuchsia toluolica TaxID=424218 RepID=A0A916J1U6_9PROT|nr:dethiobiotin synthase [Georgfuchsia toluolica]CAG4883027.1 dethiobiotin synthetase [Georgfuchsia toluolica]
MSAYFVTGTDTGVGKTFVCCALLHRFAQAGASTIGMKPVAAGLDADGCNEDVVLLRRASSVAAAPDLVNPFSFRNPVAPHLAAADENREIRFAPIHHALDALRQQADVVIVEGVGGFRVPLGPEGDSADLAQTLALPVILVVGLRLGCLNHALLTVEAIQTRGLRLAGWVANSIDLAMPQRAENIATLSELIAAPRLGIMDFQMPLDAAQAAKNLLLP